MWEHRYDNNGVLHVVPIKDLAEHTPSGCWCSPVQEETGYIVHFALDERDKFERGERKTS